MRLGRAGVIAAANMGIKPFLKAGIARRHYRLNRKRWPKVRSVAMNVFDHPFGGSGKKRPGRAKTSPRRAPPGAKVGSIAAKRTGHKN